jgi:hypothetical protein
MARRIFVSGLSTAWHGASSLLHTSSVPTIRMSDLTLPLSCQVANLEDLGFNSGILSGALVRMGQVELLLFYLCNSIHAATSELSFISLRRAITSFYQPERCASHPPLRATSSAQRGEREEQGERRRPPGSSRRQSRYLQERSTEPPLEGEFTCWF